MAGAAGRRWQELFDERYGTGAFDRLMELFAQPCVTFAEIATEFGVTRERVRQWHVKLLPGAPRGHERQHLCLIRNRQRALLTDPLFRSFFRHARTELKERRFVLIPARDGFRKRAVMLADHTIALREARRRQQADGPDESPASYTLTGGAAAADFLYYRLAGDDYLFLPREAVPPAGVTFVDSGTSRYARFRNTFSAALNRPRPALQAS